MGKPLRDIYLKSFLWFSFENNKDQIKISNNMFSGIDTQVPKRLLENRLEENLEPKYR